jgi:glycosyltransferase involved in cell wall biosynthesis
MRPTNVPQLLTVIILTYNEEIHIGRCIRSVRDLAARIIVVDSFSNDRTKEIALSLGAEFVSRKFINQAEQFQWALDNLNVSSKWIFRIDADEYIDEELQQSLVVRLETVDEMVDGIYLNRKQIFQGKWVRYGGRYPLFLMRIWKPAKGKVEQRWMDEHTVLSAESKTISMNGLVDDNLKGISFWMDKHNSYASREAIELLNIRHSFLPNDSSISEGANSQGKTKRYIKDNVYSKLPLGLRAFLYFIFRYGFQLGFLDGQLGFSYHFLQGFVYRYLVDLKVREIEIESKGDSERIKCILREKHGIEIK